VSTERAIVVAITAVVDDIGTQQTFLFGTRGWVTGPADTPPNTVVRELLTDPGYFRTELFSGARVTGLVRPNIGEVVLLNEGGVLDAWVGYGVSGGVVEARIGNLGAPYPGGFTLAYRAYAEGLTAALPRQRGAAERGAPAQVGADRIAISLQSREALLDTPIATDVFTRADTLVAGLVNKRKPWVFGAPGYVPLVLVDANLQIYYVQRNAVDRGFLFGTSPPAYIPLDGAVPLTYAGYYETPADGIDPAQAPAPGTYKVWADNGTAQPAGTYPNSVGPAYIRLGSAPVFDLRIATVGYRLTSQADTLGRWTFPQLCQQAGLADITPAALAPGSYVKQAGNYYVDADQTFLDVMNDACAASFSVFGLDDIDRFYTFDLTDPDHSGAEPSLFTFTPHNSRNLKRNPVPGQERPVWQVQVSAGKTWPGTIAGGARPDYREALSREPWHDVFTVSSDTVRRINPGALSVPVQIDGNEFQGDPARQLAFGRRFVELFGGRREVMTLECTQLDATTLGIRLGAKVTIRWPRFLCDAGRNFRVVTRSPSLKAGTITFGLWGGTAGPSDAVLGGGTALRPLDTGAGFFRRRLPGIRTRGYITVPTRAVIMRRSLPGIRTRGVVEGGSPLTGPVGLPDSWLPENDPHFANVIYLNFFAGADGANPNTALDLSNFEQNPQSAAVLLTDADAIFAPTSVDFSGSNTVEMVGWSPSVLSGTVTVITTQDWTVECIVRPATTQVRTGPLLYQVGNNFGPDWGPGVAALHLAHPSYPDAVTFWVYNFSTTTPLLIGTTDVVALDDVSHVAACRVGNEWYLAVRGAIEDTATWSGNVNTGLKVRFMGGSGNNSQNGLTGLYGAARETVNVGRYTGPYTPPAGGGAAGPDVLTPLNTLLDLQFNGTDGATATTDASVYAHPVTFVGTAQLDTAQKYSGSASLYLPNVGDRVWIPDNAAFKNLRDFKVLIAIRPNTVTDAVLLTKRSTAIVPAMLQIKIEGGKVVFCCRTSSIFEYQAPGATTVLANVWTLIEFSRSGAAFTCKVGGVVDAYLPPTAEPLLTVAAPMTIGADFDGSSPVLGHIDAAVITRNA
jgi:hypothetical protein